MKGRGWFRRCVALALGAAVLFGATPRAQAFCGFYVAGSSQSLVNKATRVSLMREGTRTVLAMSNENAPAQAPFKQQGQDRHGRPKPQLSEARVHYYGEPVALVVADTFEQATAAARLVKVSYQTEVGVNDLDVGRGPAQLLRTPA